MIARDALNLMQINNIILIIVFPERHLEREIGIWKLNYNYTLYKVSEYLNDYHAFETL